MTTLVLFVLAATGCGLVGGIFFAFSNFVMGALAQLPPAHGVTAMQAINRTVLNRWFFILFFGTALVCVVAAAWAWVATPAPALPLAAAAFYLAGSIGMTILANVPLNERLARLHSDDADLVASWNHYVRAWTRWNTVRTAACAAAAALFAATMP